MTLPSTASAPLLPDAGADRIALQGALDLEHGKELWQKLQATAKTAASHVEIDLSAVTSADGSGAALLATFRGQLRESGVQCDFVGVSDSLREVFQIYENATKARPKVRRRPKGSLDQIGDATLAFLREGQLVIAFFGQMVIGLMNTFRAPRSVNWKELMPTMEKAGADAMPIVALINFLVGGVIALQSAGQLHRFGADIFMADLVGISTVREIGPLMTAIIVCGRTGAAFAAEIGSMKTNEEIDALRTMGFGPMRFLVIPRAIGLMLIAPLITLVADIAGGLGGLMVALSRLDLSATAYLSETQRAVHLGDLFSGLIKSVAFALAIVLIACQQGLAASGGAEGVGRRTTGAVVTTLFSLIIIDAVFTIVFEAAKLR